LQNCLLDSEGFVSIIDFGVACEITHVAQELENDTGYPFTYVDLRQQACDWYFWLHFPGDFAGE
jgi:hypothetical protein